MRWIYKQKAAYSNSGASIDVAAPGGDVREDLDGDGYYDGVISTTADDSSSSLRYTFGLSAGTSMAAPHMAGVAALMPAVNPALTANDINLLLAGTHPDPNAGPITQDLGATGRDDNFGHGLIDAFQAVKVARAVAGGTGGTAPLEDTPVLAVSPNSLNFGATVTTLPLTINNAGTGSLTVTDISDDAPWLAVDASDPAALQITVDRASLTEGTALGTITITSNGGTKAVPVFAQPETDQADGDVGTAYALLIDRDSLETIASASTDVSQGYAYRIEDVPGGTYLLLAGTDRDNDGFLCHNGEACGRFPLVDSPTTITVDGDMTGLDFPAAYGFFASEESSAAAILPLPEKFPGFRRPK